MTAAGTRRVRIAGPGPAVRRIGVLVLVTATGAGAALLGGFTGVAGEPAFFLVASALLAVGLFASTSAIRFEELAGSWRVVLVAVTVGVLAKAALISAVMYGIFADPAYLVLGAAMAQIDPLSVAALQSGSRLSGRGRTVLAAWSSFDDPVTTVLVVVLAGLAVSAGAEQDAPVAGLAAQPLPTLLGNAGLLAVAVLAWWLLRRLPGRPADAETQRDHGRRGGPGGADDEAGPSRRNRAWRRNTAWRWIAVAVLVALAGAAVAGFWMLALAVTGLFFRPGIDRPLARITGFALVAATFLLGMLMAGGVDPVQGAALGAATFGAQVVVGLLVARRLPGDRLRLALGQQSGITAILLAVVLEPVLPGTAGVVGPAILVVNVLHAVSNAVLDRRTTAAAGGGSAGAGQPA